MSEEKQSAPWGDREFTHRRPISINCKLVAEDLKDFDVLFNAEDVEDRHCFDCGCAVFTSTGLCIQCGGVGVQSEPNMKEAIRRGDVMFAAKDGVTKLVHRPDEENSHLVWIKIPEVSLTEDTEFFCYYKAAGEEGL